MTQKLSTVDDRQKIVSVAIDSVLRLIKPELNKLGPIPSQLDGLKQILGTQKTEQAKTRALFAVMKEEFEKYQDNLSNRLKVVSEQIKKIIEAQSTHIETYSKPSSAKITELALALAQNHEALSSFITNNFETHYLKFEEYLRAINDKIDKLISEKLETISKDLTAQYDDISKQYDALSSKIDELRKNHDDLVPILDQVNNKLAHVKIEVIQDSYDAPQLKFSPEFKTQENKTSVINSLSKLLEIAKRNGVKGHDLLPYVKDTRDTVFQNLSRGGALLQFFKETEHKTKNEPGEISQKYQESFIKQIGNYTKICEKAAVKT